MSILQLYDYFRSSACFRVRIALELKKIPYELIPVHLINDGGEQYSANYRAINPQSLVPSLKDGKKIITQSLAIIDYLEQKYPEPTLFSIDPYLNALIKAFALTITADIHPLNNLRVLNYLSAECHLTDEMKSKWYHHWLNNGFSALEKQLDNSPYTDDFCFGKQPTLADICLVPQMFNARRFNLDLTPYPTLVRIDQNCQAQSAFIQAKPKETVT